MAYDQLFQAGFSSCLSATPSSKWDKGHHSMVSVGALAHILGWQWWNWQVVLG